MRSVEVVGIEPKLPCPSEVLDALELRLGRSLPSDFRDFATTKGAPFVGGYLEESEHEILGFLDLKRMLSDGKSVEAEYIEVGALPFARDSLGGWYLLKADDSVWFRLVHSGKLVLEQAAETFAEFLSRIVIPDGEVDQ